LAADEIYKIMLSDTSISDGKNRELYKFYDKTDKHTLSVFITETLIFSMCRELLNPKFRSVAAEVIFECKANKSCKFFVDKDK